MEGRDGPAMVGNCVRYGGILALQAAGIPWSINGVLCLRELLCYLGTPLHVCAIQDSSSEEMSTCLRLLVAHWKDQYDASNKTRFCSDRIRSWQEIKRFDEPIGASQVKRTISILKQLVAATMYKGSN
eukprot:764001-Hanusia_phi.AAC.2